MKNKTLDLNNELEIITFKDEKEFKKSWNYACECVNWEDSSFIFLNDKKVCLISKKDKRAKKIIKNIIKRVNEGWEE
jgi:hypothetical protein